MNAPIIVAICGALIGLCLTYAVFSMARPQPDLGDVAERLQGHATNAIAVPAGAPFTERLGAWIQATPIAGWISAPKADLAILGASTNKWTGDKILCTCTGLLMPMPLVVTGFLPATLLPFLSAAGAAGMFFLPNRQYRENAKEVRANYTIALSSFMGLVSLVRSAGIDLTQAMEDAAQIGDGPVFERLRIELVRARLGRREASVALSELGAQLGVTALDEIAAVARLAESGAAVIAVLDARVDSLRNALLAQSHAAATSASQRLGLATAGMAGSIMAMLLTAPLISFLFA